MSSPLARVLPVARSLDRVLAQLAKQAAQTEPPLKHKPGRSSGARWFRTPGTVPAPSRKRLVVVFG